MCCWTQEFSFNVFCNNMKCETMSVNFTCYYAIQLGSLSAESKKLRNVYYFPYHWPQMLHFVTAHHWNHINTLRPRQNGRHFPVDISKWIFLNENVCISLKISLGYVPKVRINNIPALVQIMAWRRPGDKPLSEPMMVSLLTHICVTRPQWVENQHHQEYMKMSINAHLLHV